MLTARKRTQGAKVNAVEPEEYALPAGNFSDSTLGTLEQKDEWCRQDNHSLSSPPL